MITEPAIPPIIRNAPAKPACSAFIPFGLRIASSQVVKPLKTPRARKQTINKTSKFLFFNNNFTSFMPLIIILLCLTNWFSLPNKIKIPVSAKEIIANTIIVWLKPILLFNTGVRPIPIAIPINMPTVPIPVASAVCSLANQSEINFEIPLMMYGCPTAIPVWAISRK